MEARKRLSNEEMTTDKESLVKSLRDLFRRKSSCEGQITETRVLTNFFTNWLATPLGPDPLGELRKVALDFLVNRRENLQAQILPIDQEIKALKDALKGTEY